MRISVTLKQYGCVFTPRKKYVPLYTVLHDTENDMVGINEHTVYRSLLLYFGSGNVALFWEFKSPAGSKCC